MGPNSLTFILKLQDMLTPGMRQAAGVSESASHRITSQFTGIEYSGRRMGASVNDVRRQLEAVNSIRLNTTIRREFQDATTAARALENQLGELENRGQRGGGLMRVLGGLAAGYGVASLGKMALGEAATREQQNISFEVMTGSKETGQKMVTDLVNMGAKTPYESGDLIKNAQTLKAFGLENEKILPVLNNIGDIAAGDAQKMSSLSLAFAQASSAGKLAGQDLMQMINAGFNPLQQMVKDKVFPSMMAAKEAMEKGAISTGLMEAAFKSATGPGGQFHNMMERQSQTLNGKYSTFMDNVKMKLLAFGEILMPIASLFLGFGTALIDGEGPALAIATAIAAITLALTWNSIAAGAGSVAMGIFNSVMAANPMVLVIGLLIALGVWIYSVAKKYEGWGVSVKAVWEIIKAFGNLAWIPFQSFAENAWYHVEKLWVNIKGFAQQVIGVFNNVAKAVKAALSGNFSEAKDALFADVKSGTAQELAALERSHSANQGKYAADYFKNELAITENLAKIGLNKKEGKAAGVNPVTAAAGGGGNPYAGVAGAGAAGGLSSGKGKADSINQGGQRSIVINIGKQIEKIEQHIIGGGREAAEEIEQAVKEAMRRVVYSLNGVAS